jgi:hypothetical protein
VILGGSPVIPAIPAPRQAPHADRDALSRATIARLPAPCWIPLVAGEHPEPYAHCPGKPAALELSLLDTESPAARLIPAPCWTVTCKGCGTSLFSDDLPGTLETAHAPDAEAARRMAENQDWLADGLTAWCPFCDPEVTP